MCNCAKNSLMDGGNITLDMTGNTDKCDELGAAMKASMKMNPATGKPEFSTKAWDAFKKGCPQALLIFGGQVPPLYNDVPTGNITISKDDGDIIVIGHQNPVSQVIGVAAGIATGVIIYKKRKGKNKGKKVMPWVVGILTSGVVSEAVGYGMEKFKKK